MFKNNNRQIIRTITKRSVRADRTRNIFAILAVALTTLMIFTVFSIRISFMKNYQVMDIRLSGAEASAYLPYASDEQLQEIKDMKAVAAAGVQIAIGTETQINTLTDENFMIYHWYYDETGWQDYVGAISDISGTYPEQPEEIMMSASALSKIGIMEPTLGMEIVLDETYTLTGWFTQYTQAEVVFHSESYCQERGFTLQEHGRVTVTAANGNYKAVEEAATQMQLREEQEWDFVYSEDDGSMNVTVIVLVVMVSLLIVLSGYLFIYNVMYISVAKDTRFYGLLKTIGTSPKQICKVVRGQAYVFALVGIPAGIAAGMLISFVAVPAVLGMLDGFSAMPADVYFDPLVFSGTIFFAMLTIWISCRKPARTAGKIAPAEAVKYTGTDTGNMPGERNSPGGGKISRMAAYNVFRYKKRAVLVFASLFLGTITILCVNGILGSLSVENYLAQYFSKDITITNTFTDDENAVSGQIFEQIAALPGVRDVTMTAGAELILKYDPDLFAGFLDADLGAAGENEGSDQIRQGYADGTLEYQTQVVSMTAGELESYQETSGQAVDQADFEAGKTAIIGLSDSLSDPPA